MGISKDYLTNENMWFLCPCWYCTFVHHPIQNMLKRMDRAWYELHKNRINEIKDKAPGRGYWLLDLTKCKKKRKEDKC